MKTIIYQITLSFLVITSCQNHNTGTEPQRNPSSLSVLPNVAVIQEVFSTQRDESDNVDSPAFWQGNDGQNWLLATAKEGNRVIVYDAATGEKISQFGISGTGKGELSRPNGIAVVDNYAVVVERDNHRIQVFTLPEMVSLGTFGASHLRFPYGLTIDRFDGLYHLFVTDNYETPDQETPPADSLGQRVHHFVFTIQNQVIKADHVNAFGDTSGDGVLYKVESILLDRAYNRLLIADEHEEHRNVKIYDTNGQFSGIVIPHTYFFYEPEGMVVWECETDSSGYYLMVDQGKINNTFQVFDRETMAYIGGFGGAITRNTDGIALTQKRVDGLQYGAFYPVHDDGSLTAIAWEDIAETLDLRYECE